MVPTTYWAPLSLAFSPIALSERVGPSLLTLYSEPLGPPISRCLSWTQCYVTANILLEWGGIVKGFCSADVGKGFPLLKAGKAQRLSERTWQTMPAFGYSQDRKENGVGRALVLPALTAVFAIVVAAGRSERVSSEAPLQIDVRQDLVAMGIHPTNALGDGQANDTDAIQAAIQYAAQHGGGRVFVPPGVYRVENLTVVPGAHVMGAGVEQTVFRAWDTSPLFVLKGGSLSHFTAYGTPTADKSGDGWRVGTGGVGKGGTATGLHVIRVSDAKEALIEQVQALEARYDCLYVRGSQGLRVSNCFFDRAGRNVVSMVGNDEDFVFSGCTFGSHWGLYHFDIEPGDERWVRNGLFIECTFDGRKAGEMGTGTWGAMFIFSGHASLKTRHITFIGCRFLDIAVRARGVFPGIQFLYSPQMGGRGSVFLRVPTNPVGEFRDAVVRGNRFVVAGKEPDEINSGVAFTGASVFEGNSPARFNQPARVPSAGHPR